MKTSKITGKQYSESDCIYITNMTQCHQMLNAIGPADLYDILYTSEKRPDALVFVWAKNERTAECKRLWDKRELKDFRMPIDD